MKLLVTQTWRDVIIAARLPPTVSSLLESSLTNLEGNLIPAPQGHSRGIGCDSGSDCSCSSNLASHLPNRFLTSLLVCLVAFMCKGIFMYQGCLWCDAGRFGVCLAVVSIELEEAEAPCAVMCNMSHSPGHSQVIQYHFLSSPCANRHGLRGAISGKVGKETFCSVIMCRDKWLVSRGKQMRWAVELLVKPGLIHLDVCACLHTICVDWKCDLSLSIDRENALYLLPGWLL